MNWVEMIGIVFGTGGVIAGIVQLFRARAEKDSIVISNLSSVIEEIRKTHLEFKKETDERFRDLNSKVARMERRDVIHVRTINTAYRCQLPKEPEGCPVIACILKHKEEMDKTEQL